MKYAWSSPDEVDRFIGYLRDPLYKSIAVSLPEWLSLIDLLQLRYADIKDEYKMGVVPLCIRIYRQKTNVRFLTFIGTWGVIQLKEYFEEYGKPRGDDLLYHYSGKTEHFERLVKKHSKSAARIFLKKRGESLSLH